MSLMLTDLTFMLESIIQGGRTYDPWRAAPRARSQPHSHKPPATPRRRDEALRCRFSPSHPSLASDRREACIYAMVRQSGVPIRVMTATRPT
jgi:hypothetical protein